MGSFYTREPKTFPLMVYMVDLTLKEFTRMKILRWMSRSTMLRFEMKKFA